MPPPARERADAARNRRAILEAATRLLVGDGAAGTSLDQVATAAGVSKATVLRRYGHRAALLVAVLGERETAFQEALIRGAPPLGPGAPPLERLVAFGHARLDLLEEVSELLAEAERAAGSAALSSPVRAGYLAHLARLIGDVRAPLTPDLLAQTLLDDLTGVLHVFRRRVEGRSLPQLKDHWEALCRLTTRTATG